MSGPADCLCPDAGYMTASYPRRDGVIADAQVGRETLPRRHRPKSDKASDGIRVGSQGGDGSSAPVESGSSDGHDTSKDARTPLPPQEDSDERITIAEQNTWKAKRIAHGYASAQAFAIAAGVKPNTYYMHERGQRKVSPKMAAHYERVLAQTQPLQTRREIPVVATIPAIASLSASAAVGHEPVVSVDLGTLVGATITDASMEPAYSIGDVVLHEPLEREGFDISQVDGRESVVELANGERLVRIVVRQNDGTVTLGQHHGEALRLPVNLIVAGAPIRLIVRRQKS